MEIDEDFEAEMAMERKAENAADDDPTGEKQEEFCN